MAVNDNTKSNTKKTTKTKKKKKPVNETRPLNEKEKIFCREYVKTGNGQQSALKAGYAKSSAKVTASKLLTRNNVKAEIGRLSAKREDKAIADAEEVMRTFTAIARGEVKDQFGLDASLNDRLKALQELAKRTIDIDKKIELNKQGVSDNTVTIKLDWERN